MSANYVCIMYLLQLKLCNIHFCCNNNASCSFLPFAPMECHVEWLEKRRTLQKYFGLKVRLEFKSEMELFKNLLLLLLLLTYTQRVCGSLNSELVSESQCQENTWLSHGKEHPVDFIREVRFLITHQSLKILEVLGFAISSEKCYWVALWEVCCCFCYAGCITFGPFIITCSLSFV